MTSEDGDDETNDDLASGNGGDDETNDEAMTMASWRLTCWRDDE